jgi:hypothetical protein
LLAQPSRHAYSTDSFMKLRIAHPPGERPISVTPPLPTEACPGRAANEPANGTEQRPRRGSGPLGWPRYVLLDDFRSFR